MERPRQDRRMLAESGLDNENQNNRSPDFVTMDLPMPLLLKKTLLCFFLAVVMVAAPAKPKLVLAIAVDQFRYDYLTRYRSEYTGGLNRLLTKGAVFTNANYEQ